MLTGDGGISSLAESLSRYRIQCLGAVRKFDVKGMYCPRLGGVVQCCFEHLSVNNEEMREKGKRSVVY